MFFRLLTTQLLVLSYGFRINHKILYFHSRQFRSTNFIVNQNNIHKRLNPINVVCIDRPSNSNISEKRNDLPVKKKKFYGAKVGNGMDHRMNETNYHEIVAKIKENMQKMSLLNNLENENINIHDKIALYNKYQSDYVDKNYTPTKEGSDLFEKWYNDS